MLRWFPTRFDLCLATFATLLFLCCASVSVAKVRFTGVNLAGAEFGVSNNNVNLPGTYGTHYTYPTAAEANYFVSKGLNTFRVPFRWERLQRSQFAELHGSDDGPIGELDRMDTFVNAATNLGAYVILEPHNFQRYFPATNNFQSSSQGLVGSSVPDTAYADFWGKVADHYKDNQNVIFNLMNEPNSMPTSQLVTSHNAAIQAIRDTGSRNLILVPGNQWTGAHAWNETYYNGPNSVHMLNIVDPLDNFAFDVHQYLDNDSSGTSTQIGTNQNIDNVNIGVQRLMNFTNWLHANNRKGFLGEFAVANSRIGTGATQIGDEAIQNMLNYIEANEEVWLGWAWWAAGPWWGNYMFTLEPTNLGQPSQADRPALGVLQPFAADNLPGDFNYDGTVDAADYTVWRDLQGLTGAGLDADSNIDGIVDELDFDVWKANVPEPSTLTLGLLVFMTVAASRRRAAMFRRFPTRIGLSFQVLACSIAILLAQESTSDAKIRLTGVNLAGAEFGEGSLPGSFGSNYTYPTTAEVNYFVGKGMNTFRLPFRWERLQRSQLAPLHGAGAGPTGELDRIDAFVNTVTNQGAYVILEPHNFARYFPSGSGDNQTSTNGRLGNDIPDNSFADFWGKVADHYKNNPRVIFNLMNEPTAIHSEDWVEAANAAIAAIRATGAKNQIQVPGTRWTGAWTWTNTGGTTNGIPNGPANAEALLDIVDPGDNFVVEVHQYMDFDGSGRNESIENNNPMTGVNRVTAFTNWLRANNLKGFLGEFAVPNSLIGAGMGDETINNLLNYMEANGDVWTGWAWWAAGPWWAGGPGQPPGQPPYMFLLDPTNLGQQTQTDKAAMAVLQPHFADDLPGDFNYDGTVDAADYTVWRDSQGQTGAGLDADSNIDGIVDELDFNAWKANFGATQGGGSLASVPEPGAMFSISAGILFVTVCRRRFEDVRLPNSGHRVLDCRISRVAVLKPVCAV